MTKETAARVASFCTLLLSGHIVQSLAIFPIIIALTTTYTKFTFSKFDLSMEEQILQTTTSLYMYLIFQPNRYNTTNNNDGNTSAYPKTTRARADEESALSELH